MKKTGLLLVILMMLSSCGFYIGVDYQGKTDKDSRVFSPTKYAPVRHVSAIKPRMEPIDEE